MSKEATLGNFYKTQRIGHKPEGSSLSSGYLRSNIFNSKVRRVFFRVSCGLEIFAA